MKKIVFAIVLVLTMGLGVSAQSDGFFKGDEGGGGRTISNSGSDGVDPLLPNHGVGASPYDQAASEPLGSGLLIFTALGGAYFLKKKIQK